MPQGNGISSSSGGEEFGEVVLVSSSSLAEQIVYVVIGLCLMVPLGWFSVYNLWKSYPDGVIGAVIIFAFMGVLAVISGIVSFCRGPWKAVFREGGVTYTRRQRTVVLAYSDADVGFGIGRGSDHRMVWVSPSNKREKIVAATGNLGGIPISGSQVEALRDQIVSAVAARMWSRIQQGETIKWCGRAKLAPDGVRVGSTILPWSQFSEKANQRTGQYLIQRIGSGGALTQLQMTGRNFLPGLRVIREMQAASRTNANDNGLRPI